MKKIISSCVVVFLFAITFAYAQDAKRPITVDDFFEMKTVRNPQISPDGKWIAYTVSEMDLKKDKSETRVWMISTSGGEAMPMTSKGYSAGSPRWSPDGKYLSFLAGRGKDDEGEPNKSQVWTLNRLGGEAQQITDVKQGVSGYEWSPDGKRMLLYIRDPKPEELTEDKKDDKKPKPYVIDRLQFKRDNIGYLDRYRTHLYVINIGDEKSEPIQITSGDYDDSQAVWSPDSKSIAFVSNRTEEPDSNPNSDIWIVSADNSDKGKTLLQVTKNTREDSNPSWSPDGKTIAYVTVTSPLKTMWYATNHLATIPASGGTPTIWTKDLDRNIMRPKFSADGKAVWFMLEDSGEQHLASMDIAGKKLNRWVTGESIVNDFVVQGDNLATLVSRPDLPDEIFAFSNNQLKQLTFSNKKLLDKLQFSKAESIQFKSKDGTEIEGFMYKPIGYNSSMKYPTILHNHGGPVAQFDFSFSFWAQIYAANGYLVIQTNPRGSSGYGEAFSYALFADWGNLDFQDAMAGVDYVIAQGYADPDKLGVGGWSYGGILTNYVITQTTRFKGAVSGASEANFRANYGHDHYQMWWEVELGLPWENAEAWERISPFNKVDKITTPTLWIGGAVDWNVPILNSEQMYQAMKRLGRETQLVVYPGEHHGIRRPTFQKDRFERFLGWYDKYVKGTKKSGE
jgi:dipeptidyl aminopeptidase/acylaminoacyl peptidase